MTRRPLPSRLGTLCHPPDPTYAAYGNATAERDAETSVGGEAVAYVAGAPALEGGVMSVVLDATGVATACERVPAKVVAGALACTSDDVTPRPVTIGATRMSA